MTKQTSYRSSERVYRIFLWLPEETLNIIDQQSEPSTFLN